MGSNLLGIDVGDVRVGLALAHGDVRIALPLTTLERNTDVFWTNLAEVIKINDITQLIVGLPRGLDGQDTNQTLTVKAFGVELGIKVKLPIDWQDEALTSVRAEEILKSHDKPYEKSDIDAMAASLILTDYLETHKVS